MKEFILLFRMNITDKEAQPNREQMDIYMQQWMAWINEIAEGNQLAHGGNHFSRQGRVLKSDGDIVETPHISENSSIAGYIIVLADSLDGAAEIAARCPILNGQNTSVEIREAAAPRSNVNTFFIP